MLKVFFMKYLYEIMTINLKWNVAFEKYALEKKLKPPAKHCFMPTF